MCTELGGVGNDRQAQDSSDAPPPFLAGARRGSLALAGSPDGEPGPDPAWFSQSTSSKRAWSALQPGTGHVRAVCAAEGSAVLLELGKFGLRQFSLILRVRAGLCTNTFLTGSCMRPTGGL